ncbi:proline reductase-associated electron transfer protein PrdC [Clostridium niameyense]|uniref:Proline reductase-associated electron transfer protein PrdC n=3 Tax=Clostridium niameyense TaxID=1622073 RepID=A0A6M0R755_9CLOT|nr:proline reductase-associated electron transfer protein PrdC [Clostridium niameyense]
MVNIYRFPLKMHVGAPNVPCVKEGQVVKRGECIAEPNGLGARIHTSVSGMVEKITDKEIIIKAEQNTSTDFVKIKKCKKIVDTVYEAGIVGAGGAGFPTHIKLKADIPDGYIIANCVECEPALHHNIKVIEETPEIIINGIRYAMEATKAPKAYIAIKSKHPEAIKSLEKCLNGAKDIEIKALPDLYPMGEERAIINAIFDKWLEPTQLPVEAKCVVLNAETLANITRAVEDRKPVIDKDVTVIGKLKTGNKPNVFIQVPVGTPVKDLVEQSGGIDGEYGEVVIGGPYTGKAGNLEEDALTKMSGGIIVTIPLPEYKGPLGLLVCACGANEDRLKDVANKMNASIAGVVDCKNIEYPKGKGNGPGKCKTPGE